MRKIWIICLFLHFVIIEGLIKPSHKTVETVYIIDLEKFLIKIIVVFNLFIH